MKFGLSGLSSVKPDKIYVLWNYKNSGTKFHLIVCCLTPISVSCYFFAVRCFASFRFRLGMSVAICFAHFVRRCSRTALGRGPLWLISSHLDIFISNCFLLGMSVTLVKNEAHWLGPVLNVFWINDIKHFQTVVIPWKIP